MLALKNQWLSPAHGNGVAGPNESRCTETCPVRTELHLAQELALPRAERSPAEKVRFYAANAVLLPVVASLYTHVVSGAFRFVAPDLANEAYKLPIPGFAWFESVDGWNCLDMAQLIAIVLFLQLACVWAWMMKPDTELGEGYGICERLGYCIYCWLRRYLALMLLFGEYGLLLLSIHEVLPSSLWGNAYEVPACMAMYCIFVRFQIARWHHRFRYET